MIGDCGDGVKLLETQKSENKINVAKVVWATLKGRKPPAFRIIKNPADAGYFL